MNERLFSYGTLQNEAVQLEKFGRLLTGVVDTLIGYRLSTLEIKDAEVIALSGARIHPVLVFTGDSNDTVEGTIFSLTAEELRQADDYEVDEYMRVSERFSSGTVAWVYVSAEQARASAAQG